VGFINIGPLELIVILIIALLVLGPQRLPEAARSVGRGMREMREALAGHDDDEDELDDEDEDEDEIEDPVLPTKT
jgi:sec-independent protein translocase protein TatA